MATQMGRDAQPERERSQLEADRAGTGGHASPGRQRSGRSHEVRDPSGRNRGSRERERTPPPRRHLEDYRRDRAGRFDDRGETERDRYEDISSRRRGGDVDRFHARPPMKRPRHDSSARGYHGPRPSTYGAHSVYDRMSYDSRDHRRPDEHGRYRTGSDPRAGAGDPTRQRFRGSPHFGGRRNDPAQRPRPDQSPEMSLTAAGRPTDWVQEKTHDGRDCWRNVFTLELSWSEPLSWRQQGPPAERVWEKQFSDDGRVQFRHKVTGQVITPKRSSLQVSEKRRKDMTRRNSKKREGTVDDKETALGRKIFNLTEKDLIRREGHLGSTRSLLDREKYYTEFQFKVDADGSGQIVRRADQTVISKVAREHVDIYKANPHLHQIFANSRPFIVAPTPFTDANRVASDDLSPRTPYARRQGEVKTVEHWGQRKLLMSEIEFLTLYGDRSDLVVYAGAAPGKHIPFLASLFPSKKWVLVDPAPFDIAPSQTIEIRQDYFTDEMAGKFEQGSMLFICDIRSMDAGFDDQGKEARVSADMQWQEKWVRIMKPKASMLKFRLPYPEKTSRPDEASSYLAGRVFLPVWGGRTTTETRLVVTDPDSRRDWNHKDYEQFMFHFNVTTRTSYWKHDLAEPGYDHCFDCCSEICILAQYFTKSHDISLDKLPEDAKEKIVQLAGKISRECSKSGRSLVLPCVKRHFE